MGQPLSTTREGIKFINRHGEHDLTLETIDILCSIAQSELESLQAKIMYAHLILHERHQKALY